MLFGKHVNKYYKKYFWYFFFGIIAVITVDYIQFFIPEIIGQIIDDLENGVVTINSFEPLIRNVFYILIVGVGLFIGRFIWRICIFGESKKIQADLRYEMFKKTEILSQRYYKENKTGAILSYFSNDLETIEESFGFGVVQLIDGVFLLIISLIKMFMVQPILTSITLIPIIGLGLVAYFVDKMMEKAYDKRQQAYDDLSDFAQENFTGIRVIKAFVKEKKELKAFKEVAARNKETNINFVKKSQLLEILFDLFIYSIICICLAGGAYLVYLYIYHQIKLKD